MQSPTLGHQSPPPNRFSSSHRVPAEVSTQEADTSVELFEKFTGTAIDSPCA
jgi:hypothetical protein